MGCSTMRVGHFMRHAECQQLLSSLWTRPALVVTFSSASISIAFCVSFAPSAWWKCVESVILWPAPTSFLFSVSHKIRQVASYNTRTTNDLCYIVRFCYATQALRSYLSLFKLTHLLTSRHDGFLCCSIYSDNWATYAALLQTVNAGSTTKMV